MAHQHKLKAAEMGRLSIEEFKSAQKLPLVVVLDNVRSLYNVGSVFRTADAFLCRAVYLCGITATPPNNEIHKTALGAEQSMDWQYFSDTMQAVEQLQSEGYRIWAVEQVHRSTPLHLLPTCADTPCAIVLGNEVKGVQQAVVEAADGCIEIPQFGTKHSLNVSTTAGIVIWEMAQRLGMIKQP